MQNLVSAEELADHLNKLPLSNPMWAEGGFRVGGRWLEIDPDLSDQLAAAMLKCDLETARRRNDAEARWFVAGGVAVVYVNGKGWRPVKNKNWLRHNPDEETEVSESA
jgi:hypothetical protein